MSTNPLISIVIPHFNRSELLGETLQSIRRQEYENWEVLIVDDGSEDREWALVQTMADGKIRVFQRDNGVKGPSRCRNLGASESEGDFLIFIDSDDILAPWCLSQRMVAARKQSTAELWVFPVMLFSHCPGDLATCWNRLEGNADLDRFLRSDPPWHTSSPLWRKSAFSTLGGFNENVLYGDDAELHSRALLRGISCQKFPNSLPDVFIRRSAEQRITNQLDEALVHSRITRLSEGTLALNTFNAAPCLMKVWEGQYFVEAEFLLFNMPGSQHAIRKVLQDWVLECKPPVVRRMFVKTYFCVAQIFHHHFYFGLRVARRLMRLILPGAYFPNNSFQKVECSADIHRKIQQGFKDAVFDSNQ